MEPIRVFVVDDHPMRRAIAAGACSMASRALVRN
jgi:hypothetical protein